MCNHTSQKVWVAIGYQESGHWLSKGWFGYEPNECDRLYPGVPQNTNFYFYAHSTSRKTIWGGENDPNRGYFCTSDQAFYYNSDSNNCEGKRFQRINLDGADQYTFTLTEGSDPTAVAARCQSEIANGREAFAKCWMRGMATEKQREILDCWDKTSTPSSFGVCAAKNNLGHRELEIADCTQQYYRDKRSASYAACLFKDQIGILNDDLLTVR
jgi:uncharacterized membrane protein